MSNKKESVITLNFDDKSISSLAGYDFGERTYLKQVDGKIDSQADEIIIIFPDEKSGVASSFIEGFFNKLKEDIGLTQIRKKVKIKSKYPGVVSKINNELYFED